MQWQEISLDIQWFAKQRDLTCRVTESMAVIDAENEKVRRSIMIERKSEESYEVSIWASTTRRKKEYVKCEIIDAESNDTLYDLLAYGLERVRNYKPDEFTQAMPRTGLARLRDVEKKILGPQLE